MSQAIVEKRFQLSNTSETAEVGGSIEQIPVSASFEETQRIFERDGVVCLTDAFSPEVVAEAVGVLDSFMSAKEMEHFYHENNEILGVLTKRRSEILAAAPDLMTKLLTQPRLMELVKGRLTKYATSVLIHQVMGLEIYPGEVAQRLHRDNAIWSIPGQRIPLGVALMIPLEDYRVETGATRVILGSHLWPEAQYIDPKDIEDRRKGGGFDEYAQPSNLEPEMESVVEVPLGSLVVFDGDLLHGGGANETKDRVRKSLLIALIGKKGSVWVVCFLNCVHRYLG